MSALWHFTLTPVIPVIPGYSAAAVERIDQTLAFAPDFVFGWQVKGFIHIVKSEFPEARAAFQQTSDLEGPVRPDQRMIDLTEAFVRTGKAGQPPDWVDEPNLIDPFFVSMVLVCAGQYEAALDWVERHAKSTIPELAVSNLNSTLFHEKMDGIPRYRELLEKLTPVGIVLE